MLRWLLNYWRRRDDYRRREWASVPPPAWGAKRSGRDYW
jgi:hypothetical protein